MNKNQSENTYFEAKGIYITFKTFFMKTLQDFFHNNYNNMLLIFHAKILSKLFQNILPLF